MKRLETERCILRPFEQGDLDALYDYAKSEVVGPMAGWAPHTDKAVTQIILNDFIEKEEVYAIEMKATGVLAGSLGIHPDKERNYENCRMIGYVLKEELWGQGIMPEVVMAVLHYLFDEKQLEVVSISHFPFNHQSRRVIEKCGFKKEGILRRAFQLPNQKWTDKVIYSLLKEEFKS